MPQATLKAPGNADGERPSLRQLYRQSMPVQDRLIEWSAAIALTLAIIAPRGIFLYLALFALTVTTLAVSATVREPRGLHVRDWLLGFRQPPVLAFLAFLLFAATSSLWALRPDAALLKPALLLIVLILTVIGLGGIAKTSPSGLWMAARGAIHGTAIGLVYLALEHATGGQLKALFINATGLSPSEMTFNVVKDGEVIEIARTFLNRHSAALSLLLYPAAACLTVWLGPQRKVPIAVLLGAAFIVVIISDSETAKLAAVASLAVLMLSVFFQRMAAGLLMAGWSVAALAMPLLVGLVFSEPFGWQRHLPASAYDRAEIWRYTTDKTWQSPIIGVGANQTRYLSATPAAREDRIRRANAQKPHAGFVPVPRLSVHAHNMFVQTWFELGAIGAALLAIVGVTLIKACGRLAPRVVPFALAAFAGGAVVALTGYGMWQIWLVSAAMLAALLLSVASSAITPVTAKR